MRYLSAFLATVFTLSFLTACNRFEREPVQTESTTISESQLETTVAETTAETTMPPTTVAPTASPTPVQTTTTAPTTAAPTTAEPTAAPTPEPTATPSPVPTPTPPPTPTPVPTVSLEERLGLKSDALISVYLDSNQADYKSLKDRDDKVTVLDTSAIEGANQKVKIRVESPGVIFYMEVTEFIPGMDLFRAYDEVFRVTGSLQGEVYEFDMILAEGIPTYRLVATSGDYYQTYFMSADMSGEYHGPVYLPKEEVAVEELSTDSNFVTYCGLIALANYRYETEVPGAYAPFYEDPYYYWYALSLVINQSNPHYYAYDRPGEVWPLEEWLVNEHLYALFGMTDSMPPPIEPLAWYIPERYERYDIQAIPVDDAPEVIEPRYVTKLENGSWEVGITIIDANLENNYVLTVEEDIGLMEFFQHRITSIQSLGQGFEG